MSLEVSAFDELYGLVLDEASPDRVRGHVPITDRCKQPYGLVHGGLLAAVAETLASVGTAIAAHAEGNLSMGMSNSTSFLRPMREGTVHADARPLHRGRTTWIWDVEFTDDEGNLCAISRMTVAVRPPRA